MQRITGVLVNIFPRVLFNYIKRLSSAKAIIFVHEPGDCAITVSSDVNLRYLVMHKMGE